MKWFYTLGCFVLFFFATSQMVDAAHIFLDYEADSQNLQDTFYIPIRIDTQGECINALRIAVAYDPTQISIVDVSTGDSVLTLWTQTPTVQRVEGKEIGRVVLEGGVPGGYCGRLPGDPGQVNIVAKLVVTGVSDVVNEIKTTQLIVEPETVVFLNDGRGTEAELTVLGVNLALTQSTTSPDNIWLYDVRSDESAPQFFEIIFVEGPSEGNSKHYIAFNTTDKQSGIDHYEVLETDPDRFGFLSWVSRESYWVQVKSPYVLRDQKLKSKIMVKAVDKNGNERIITYTPQMSVFKEFTSSSNLVFFSVILLVLMLGVLLILKRKKGKKKESDLKNDENYIDD